MKIIILLVLLIATHSVFSQDDAPSEKYGKSLNLSGGIGYYRYVGYNRSVLHADYEFQIGNALTVAPSISLYNYEGHTLWGDPNHQIREYYYSEIVVPVGLKVSFYFDKIFKAGPKWDFYAASSLGTNFRKTNWETDYNGKYSIEPDTGPVYIDLHIGSEYHITNKIGIQLDLSTAISTFGMAIHF